MKRLLMSLAVTCVIAASSRAQVVLSEIHYHPVEEPAFDAEGNPVLDLSDDVFEFVEIENTGTKAVDLSGWTLAGGISYTFPAGAAIAPGAFRVIAKAPALLASVYALDAADVLGPYAGQLSNSRDTVRLRNATGNTVDSVTYDSLFPWAQSADALGAQDRFLGLKSSDYQYKGRSLQRVSATWASGDPANWLASPLSGPTPGGPQAVTRDEPKPIVVAFSAVQASDGGVIIRPGADATVNCTYSGTNNLTNVVLEYFVDNINATGETRTSITMTGLGDGRYTATIPGQTSRSVVRYRFLADRGDGLEVVSPRADDPQIAPVGEGGAREAWHGYFVTPVRSSSNAAVYDVLVSSAGLSTMSTNITQNPKRVTAASATGQPRAVPYVASTAPQWNGTVPAVFACNGEVWDIHIRYHGSRYHRSPSTHSYKLHFPEHHPLNGQTAWFETLHGTEFIEAQRLNRLLGLPASKMRRVDWYFNSSSNEVHSEQGEYAGEMLEEYHRLQQQLNPGSELEESGELYKDVGNREAEQNNTEGPYTRGTSAPMLANAGWTQLQRYEWTFSLQNHDWKGSKPIRDLIEGMWAARGDTITTHNFSSDPAKLARAKQWFYDNFDMETTLTSMALLEWMSIWDDACQNHFFWRRADGRWSRLGWDYDQVMATSGGIGGGTSQTIYGGEYGAPTVFDGVNWWKDTFYKCFREEYKKRLWELTNSFCDATNLAALGFSKAAAFAPARKTYINTQLAALGTYYKPNRPSNTGPANGASVVGTANLATSAYSHPQSTAHGSTRWEIRTRTGDYEEPVLRTTTSAHLTSFPIPFERLTYGQTYYWRATHIDANGHPSIVSAETSFTWGTVNTTAGAIVLNEILASNRNAVQNGGGFPDYVEIRNNGATPASLTGFSLTDDPLTPARFVFPEGTTLPAGGYLVVWCDSDISAPGLHAGFAVDAGGETLLLMNGGTIVDSVSFGPQAPDVSIGRIVDGAGGWQANEPTPGTSNNARTLGAVTSLRINEWMADPAYGDDWFEIYNTDSNVVALDGLYLSDTPSSPRITQIPPLSFIEAGGYTRFLADGSDVGANHVNFRLGKSGESLVLTASNGATTIDTVTFSTQATDVSQGRLPDGTSTIVYFQHSASPGFCNWAPNGVYINELLANSVWPLEDAVEIVNTNASAVDISGWWLTDDFLHRRKFQVPAGTTIPPGGHVVFYAADLAAGGSPVEFNARGDEAMLSAVDASGALTGYGSLVRFGASAENVSFGRVDATGLNATSGGAEFWPLTAHTFGVDNASTTEVFRTGKGKANAPAMSGPVVINEVMYHPLDFAGEVDNTRDEFIEIVNAGSSAVDLGGWRLKGDTLYTFPIGTTLAAGGNLVVVGFDPSDAATLAAFRAAYGLGGSVTIHGPFSTKLANSTGVLELAYPATINGFTGYVIVDRVEYRDMAPWPTAADGEGKSLQRLSSGAIGNTASNWSAGTPNPGVATVPFAFNVTHVGDCLRWAAGLSTMPSAGVSTYDVVTDGKVNILDAARIARKVMGLDTNP